MQSIALIGPSGVGKGSHARSLAEQLKLNCCITGDLLRDNIANQTAVGFMAQRYIENGAHVPDHIVNAVVEEWLCRVPEDSGLLFVGFPRTRAQAESLDALLTASNRQLNKVINLEVTNETVNERLTGRILCSDCKQPYHQKLHPPKTENRCDRCDGALITKPEDIPELVKVRLRTFRRTVKPMLGYYDQSDRLIHIDANPGLDQVSHSLHEAARELQQGHTDQPHTTESKEDRSAAPQGSMISRETATHDGFDILLLGGPGSGKGTQAEHLRSQFNLPHIATGDLFRENLNNNTSLGRLAKRYMDKGALVADDVTEAMVEERLGRADVDTGFILDGFPRNISQTHALTDILNIQKRRIKCALYIHVSDEEIIQRLSGRLVCRGCQTPFHIRFKPPTKDGQCDLCDGELYQRDDDNPKTVGARLVTYHENTGPVLHFYREQGLLYEIDGEGLPAVVIERSSEVIEKIRKT